LGTYGYGNLPIAYGKGWHASDSDETGRNTGKEPRNEERYCISSCGVASGTTEFKTVILTELPRLLGDFQVI